jgi:methyl-accepting chemotaxis protein
MVDLKEPGMVEDAEPMRASPAQGMIRLPTRGQRLATAWLVGGIVFYVVLAGVFFSTLMAADADVATTLRELIALGDAPNYSIAVLVIVGALVTLAASASVFVDIREIRREEEDIEWLIHHGGEYTQLVLASRSKREELRAKGVRTVAPKDRSVETLTDDRVRRIMAAQGSERSTMVPVEELRVIAQTRTARFGGFARYATSLLLLLAVLGTFAGVKTALPGLIEAVTASNEGTAASGSIVAPLRAVADAFGANALALIGAIAVGLMAHGVAAGRRNLLERLEWVSAEYIYGTRQMDSVDPLRAAVQAMRETVEQVRETSGSLLGIEAGLANLGQEFAHAFDSLDERLTTIVEQQDERLHERTSDALEELRERVAELAEVVDANTRAYAGLVDRIGERSEEAKQAIDQLAAANRSLAAGLEGAANLTAVSQKAGEEVGASISRIEEATDQVLRQVGALSSAVNLVGPSLDEARSSLVTTSQNVAALNDRTSKAIQELNDRAAAAWVNAGRELEQHISRIASDNGRVPQAMAPDATRLLSRIAASLDDFRPAKLSTAQLVALPSIGVFFGGAGLFGVYTLLRSGIVTWLLNLVGLG